MRRTVAQQHGESVRVPDQHKFEINIPSAMTSDHSGINQAAFRWFPLAKQLACRDPSLAKPAIERQAIADCLAMTGLFRCNRWCNWLTRLP